MCVTDFCLVGFFSWKVYLFIYFFLSFQVPPSLQSNWPQLCIGLLLHLSFCWGPRSLAKQRVQVSLPKEIIISPTFFARPQSRAGPLEGLSGGQRESVRAGRLLASPPTRFTSHAKPGQATRPCLLHRHHSPGLSFHPAGSFSVLLQNRDSQVGIRPGANHVMQRGGD